ncbi:MAG: 50S ribosomal protein L3 N(5)-glutamine methyltransferase [Magnetococcales bacterium]|nr:50S ribosomal protein L3 N(5)-glutamine methyltransferase [Magnetococcales bacterium]
MGHHIPKKSQQPKKNALPRGSQSKGKQPTGKTQGRTKRIDNKRVTTRRVGDFIRATAKRLRQNKVCLENGMQTPQWEAEYLIAHILDLPVDKLDYHRHKPVDAPSAARIETLLDLRINEHIPAAYLTKEAYFAGHRFFVDERVLIPRSRIENILDDEDGFPGLMNGKPIEHILDLATGSGCLAISLALAFPSARVVGSDISEGALAVAKINRKKHHLEKRLTLVHSNLFHSLATECYDLIVTNPPYVPNAVVDNLPPEYRKEPDLALRAGDDGLSLVTPLLKAAPDHLTPGGLLVCEVGDEQEETMKERWPDFPGYWLPFHFGASGVFAIHRETLQNWVNDHELG